jgi:linoleoyl-CoA desaturase
MLDITFAAHFSYMVEQTFKAVRFIPKDDRDFGIAVRKRVHTYFKSNKISRLGDYRIWIKVFVLPLIYLVSFGILMSNNFTSNLLIFYGLWVVMGIGLAGSGLGIMHDACHGALSKKKWVNDFIGTLVLSLAGGSVINWKIQHNVLHHSYTNIDGYDEDIDPGGLMRFSPHQPVKPLYRFQAVYAWFLYGLMTFAWATFKDFLQLSRYNKKGLVEKQGTTYKKELIKLIVLKVVYYIAFMVLPIMVLDIAWWHVALGWFSMHFVSGLILGCVFQPAHVVPTSEFPLPDSDNNVEGDRDMHQLLTTSNFSPKNKILGWYMGGLNFQIEHHLFPTMSHVHHKSISKIVESTAKEFGLPYNSQPTFVGALVNHGKMLYKLRK